MIAALPGILLIIFFILHMGHINSLVPDFSLILEMVLPGILLTFFYILHMRSKYSLISFWKGVGRSEFLYCYRVTVLFFEKVP